MSRTKTLSIAVDKETNELIGYWSPQNGIGGIVVRADNQKLLERKFERALRHFDKKQEEFQDQSRTAKKSARVLSHPPVRVHARR